MKKEHAIYSLPLLRPMLAVSSSPFNSADFLFEVKWDGYRCLAYLEEQKTVLCSRNLRELNTFFPELTSLHTHIKGRPSLLDGEIVILRNGLPSFECLQRRSFLFDPQRINQLAGKNPALFIAFDILYLKGLPCLNVPLKKRRDILADNLSPGGPLVISEFIYQHGKEFFQACAEKGLEGVMAKHLDSPYLPGRRSSYWQKFRSTREIDLVICGYQKGQGERKLSALVLGEKVKGKLIYRGKVGIGFSREEEEKLLKWFDCLEVKDPVFDLPLRKGQNIRWLKPVLFCSVDYLSLTENGLLRHPLYRGICWEKTLVKT